MFCRVILTVTAVLLSAAAAQAAPVFGNGNLSNTGVASGVRYGAHDYYAVPFQTGTSSPALTLTGAYVLIGGQTVRSVDTVFELWTDSGSGPGSQVGQSSAVVSIASGSPTGWTLLTFASPVTLTASTNYYAVFGTTTNLTETLHWYPPATNQSYTDFSSGSGYSTDTSKLLYGTIDGQQSWASAGSTLSSTP